MQEVFNIAYHLKQPVDSIMSWPSDTRQAMWEKLLEQYEFEKKERDKS